MGTFGGEAGLRKEAACSSCPAGSYGLRAGTAGADIGCVKCPAGTHSSTLNATSIATCAACPPGTMSPVLGAVNASVCEACPTGTYAQSGSEECLPCPAGSYSSVRGARRVDECELCPAGTYGVGAGFTREQDACAPCPAGTANPVAGGGALGVCKACAAGLVAQESGQSECLSCGAGTFAANATLCEPCPPWAKLSAVGDRCDEPCPPGSVPSEDHRQCDQCVPGRFADGEGREQCMRCPRGTFAEGLGASKCTSCAMSTYSAREGRAQCDACPADRETQGQGATSHLECACKADIYAPSYVYEEREASCQECKPGMACEGDRMPAALPGFWFDPSPSSFDVMLPCSPDSACRGGTLFPDAGAHCALATLFNASEGAVATACPGGKGAPPLPADTLCADGYTGDRCSSCQPGFYRLNSDCLVCPDLQYLPIVLVVGAVCLMGAVAVVIVRMGISLAPLTISVDFFQVLSRILTVRARWSSTTREVLKFANVFTMDVEVMAPECFVETSYLDTWKGVMVFPLLCVTVLMVVHLLLAVSGVVF